MRLARYQHVEEHNLDYIHIDWRRRQDGMNTGVEATSDRTEPPIPRLTTQGIFFVSLVVLPGPSQAM